MNRRLVFEIQVVEAMIRIYCRDHHASTVPCRDCSQLLQYAEKRLVACPLSKNRPDCADCSIHCYRPDMRERMKAVMRYAGPRMPLRHPLMTIRYFFGKSLRRNRDRSLSPFDDLTGLFGSRGSEKTGGDM